MRFVGGGSKCKVVVEVVCCEARSIIGGDIAMSVVNYLTRVIAILRF